MGEKRKRRLRLLFKFTVVMIPLIVLGGTLLPTWLETLPAWLLGFPSFTLWAAEEIAQEKKRPPEDRGKANKPPQGDQ